MPMAATPWSIPAGYAGVLLLRVVDTADGADYRDEASGAALDLGTDLRAATVVTAPGSYTIHITPLTELALRLLGLQAGDNASSSVDLTGIPASAIALANSHVAAALGLAGVDILSAATVATIGLDGSPNAAANALGRVLAAISGMQAGSGATTDQVLQYIASRITQRAPIQRPGLRFDGRSGHRGVPCRAISSALPRPWGCRPAMALQRQAPGPLSTHWSTALLATRQAPKRRSTPRSASITCCHLHRPVCWATSFVTKAWTRSIPSVKSAPWPHWQTRCCCTAAGTPQDISQADLETLGIAGLNPARLADLLHTLAASADDGNAADTLAELQAMVDTQAPAAPAITGISSGTSINIAERDATGGITILGTKERGSAIALRLLLADGTAVVDTIALPADTATTWSYVLSKDLLEQLGQGDITLLATATDAAQNTSPDSAALVVAIDTVAPEAPSLALPAFGGSTAPGNFLNIANAAQAFTGTLSEGVRTVTLHIGGHAFDARIEGLSWSYALTPGDLQAIGQGETTVWVTATDSFGNTSPDSQTLPLTVDTAAPAVPSVDASVANTTINARQAAIGVALSGRCEAGATVVFTIGGTVREIASLDGTWSYLLVQEDYVAMGDGDQRLDLYQIDPAGNRSDATSLNIAVDINAPEAPSLALPASSGSTVPGNFLDIANASQAFTGTLSEGVRTVTLHIGGHAFDARIEGLSWSYALTPGDLQAIGQGETTVWVTATDSFGNTSPDSQTLSPTVDTAAPACAHDRPHQQQPEPTRQCHQRSHAQRPRWRHAHRNRRGPERIWCCTLAAWTGTLPWHQTVPGATSSPIQTTTTCTSSPNQRLTVTHTDAAGNTSASALDIVVDTSIPSVPVITEVSDGRFINRADFASNRQITIRGTLDGSATEVQLYIGNAGPHYAKVNGLNWEYTIGVEAFLDWATSTSKCPQSPLTVQATPAPCLRLWYSPSTPMHQPSASKVSTASAPTTPSVPPSSPLASPSGAPRRPGVPPACASATDWWWTCQQTSSAPGAMCLTAESYALLDEGPQVITLTQTDAAGNTSSTAIGVNVDTVAPAISIQGIDGIGTDNTISATELSAGVTIRGTKQAGRAASLRIGDHLVVDLPADKLSTWNYVLSAEAYALLGEGPQVITLTQTDAAGNTSSTAIGVTVDTVAPAISINDIAGFDGSTNVINAATRNASGGVTLTGSGEFGAQLVLRIGKQNRDVVVAEDGTWSYTLTDADYSNMADNTSQTLTVTQTDAAGNTSTTEDPYHRRHGSPWQSASTASRGSDTTNLINAAMRNVSGGVTLTGNGEFGAPLVLRIGGQERKRCCCARRNLALRPHRRRLTTPWLETPARR